MWFSVNIVIFWSSSKVTLQERKVLPTWTLGLIYSSLFRHFQHYYSFACVSRRVTYFQVYELCRCARFNVVLAEQMQLPLWQYLLKLMYLYQHLKGACCLHLRPTPISVWVYKHHYLTSVCLHIQGTSVFFDTSPKRWCLYSNLHARGRKFSMAMYLEVFIWAALNPFHVHVQDLDNLEICCLWLELGS